MNKVGTISARIQRVVGLAGASAAALLLSAQTFGAPWGELPVDPPDTYERDNFVILVKDKIRIPDRFTIFPDPDASGSPGRPRADIGAQGPDKGNKTANTEGKISLGARAYVSVPSDASDGVFKDVAIVAGEKLELFRFSQVVDVIADLIDPNTPRVAPLAEKPLGDNDLPSIPEFSASFNPSADPADDVICPRNSSVPVEVLPGTYRDLIINANCSVILKSAGEYVFRLINTQKSFGLYVDDAVNETDLIVVKAEEFMRLQEFGVVNGVNDALGITKSHKVLEFHVRGEDGEYRGDNNNPDGLPLVGAVALPAAFTYFGDGQFNACRVIVPNGTVGFGGHGAYATQILGQSFNQLNNISMSFQAPPPECFDLAAVVQCACISDFEVIPEGGLTGQGLNIRATGENLAVDTFQQLGIFTSTFAFSLDNPPANGDAGADQPSTELVFVTDKIFDTKDDASGDSLCEQINNANGPGDYSLVIIGDVDTNTVSGVDKTIAYCIYNANNLRVYADGSCSKI